MHIIHSDSLEQNNVYYSCQQFIFHSYFPMTFDNGFQNEAKGSITVQFKADKSGGGEKEIYYVNVAKITLVTNFFPT